MNLAKEPADMLRDTNRVPIGVPGGFFVYSVFDDKGICYADPNVLELFDCQTIDELRELTDNSFIGMVHPDDRNRVADTVTEYNSDIRMPHNYIRYRIITRQGTYRYVEDFGHRMHCTDGRTYCYVFISGIEQAAYESAQQVIMDDELISGADLNTDRLTGLLNMDTFYLKAKEMRESENSTEHTAVVIVFDILDLRGINRTLGHAEGDARICDLAEAVRANLPGECCLYRGHEADIIAVCENLREEDLMDSIMEVVLKCKSPILFGIGSCYDQALASSTDDCGLLWALEGAQLDLRIKKLLNVQSYRSQSLTSLIRALEEVDADTEAHVQRTQKIGIALGRKIGLSDLQLSLLQLLCLLHDIGKIAVPLEILNKPGKLTEDEWSVLRSHPDKGYQIAVATDELKPLADMIRSHHERWDGKGYPDGLTEEKIPVLSRIISIVDAYDAMVNDRSYRKALSPEKAMQEIADNAGTQFDPHLAAAFLALLEESPVLSVGSKTDSASVPVFERTETRSTGTGSTKAVNFAKYKLNLDDVIIDVDDSFVNMTGYSREDAIGKLTQYDLIPEQERDFYIEQVRLQFSSGDIAYLQHPLKRKDGTVIQVICNGERYFDSSVRAFRSTVLVFEVS